MLAAAVAIGAAATLALAAAATLALAAPALAASELYIRGGGYGHGIGMSQYGAYGYALHGKDYKFILRHYFRGTALGHADPSQLVRVLVATGPASVSGASAAAGKRLNPSLTYAVRPLASGLVAVFDATGNRVARGPAPLTVTGVGPLTVPGVGTYRGSLEFRPDAAGGAETIDAVGLDDYVRGVISEEMPSSWAPEALKVQAVAARTYAITTDAGGDGFDLYPDTRSQMYGGVGAETAATDAAVAASRGQIVTYGGTPAVTYFFSSSGGHTENVENVWPGSTPEPWLRGVPDPYDGAGGDPYHRWSYTMTAAAAASKLGALVSGSLVGIRVTKTGASPRVLAAKVIGTAGTVKVRGVQLQQVFGLPTTYASFTTVSTAVRFGAAAEPRVAGARAIAALVPLVQAVVKSGAPRLTGRVVPAHVARSVSLMVERHGAWRPARAHAKIGAAGAYTLMLPGAGVYRVMAGGFAGPAVTVG
jgi:stage II sporulation protein D